MTRAPGSEVEVYTSSREGAPRGTVAFCVRDHMAAGTVTSLWTSDWSWLGSDQSVERVIIQGSILTLQRNEALKRMKGDWLVFIDDDMVWDPKDIGRLVLQWEETSTQVEEPVLMGALCHRRQSPYDPTMYVRETATKGRYRFLEKWDGEVVEVDATGLAFLLIPVAALERMLRAPWPNHETRQLYPPPEVFVWRDRLGEDLRFCQDMKAAGCRIFVDTRIEIGHLAEVRIGHQDFLREVALRSEEDEAFVRAANDRMGLPTLTAAEARERLGW